MPDAANWSTNSIRSSCGTPTARSPPRPPSATASPANRDTSFVPLHPSRVVEVAYDQMEGARFRHSAQFVRWRPDREASSCGFDQLERPVAYDLDDVLG